MNVNLQVGDELLEMTVVMTDDNDEGNKEINIQVKKIFPLSFVLYILINQDNLNAFKYNLKTL